MQKECNISLISGHLALSCTIEVFSKNVNFYKFSQTFSWHFFTILSQDSFFSFCKMDSTVLEKFRRDNSLEDFEFLDCNGDLEVDLSKSPLNGAADKIISGISTIMSALSLIAEQEGFTVTVPVQAVAATAVGAITGSLLGGPPGLAIGLLTGAVIAYRTSPQKPVVVPKKSTIREIFSQMTFQQKKELVKELLVLLKQSNARSLILELLKNETIRNMAMEIISNYLKRKMGVGLKRSGK